MSNHGEQENRAQSMSQLSARYRKGGDVEITVTGWPALLVLAFVIALAAAMAATHWA